MKNIQNQAGVKMQSNEAAQNAVKYLMNVSGKISGLTMQEGRNYDMALEVINNYVSQSPQPPTKPESVASPIKLSKKDKQFQQNMNEAQAVS